MKFATASLIGLVLSANAPAVAQPVKGEDILSLLPGDWNDEGDGSTSCAADFFRMSVDPETSVMTNTKTDAATGKAIGPSLKLKPVADGAVTDDGMALVLFAGLPNAPVEEAATPFRVKISMPDRDTLILSAWKVGDVGPAFRPLDGVNRRCATFAGS